MDEEQRERENKRVRNTFWHTSEYKNVAENQAEVCEMYTSLTRVQVKNRLKVYDEGYIILEKLNLHHFQKIQKIFLADDCLLLMTDKKLYYV